MPEIITIFFVSIQMERHRFYLLHIWTKEIEDPSGEGIVMQAALEEPHTGRKWGFRDMESLVNFMTTVLAEAMLNNRRHDQQFADSHENEAAQGGR